LLRGDLKPEVATEHVFIATELLGVLRRSAHHLTPPDRDVAAMLIAHPPTEYRGQKFILLDEVIEHVEPVLERLWPARPLKNCRGFAPLGRHVLKVKALEDLVEGDW
jgi:hypothetical protein